MLISMAKSSWYKIVCMGFLLAALAAAGITFRLYTTRAGYVLERGRAALEGGDWNQANRCLELLEQRGYADHAHLLGGEFWLCRARFTPETTNGFSPPTIAAQNTLHRALADLAQISVYPVIEPLHIIEFWQQWRRQRGIWRRKSAAVEIHILPGDRLG